MRFLIFGGGGLIARHFARNASKLDHKVVSVIRNDTHWADLEEMGATPTVLSLEDASIKDMEDLIKKEKPDAVIFSAGAGGKGGPERTRAVDYEGSVKVYEACQGAGVKRLLLVSAFDVRDRSNPVPEWYTKEDIEACSRVWAAIGHYMQAKYDSEKALRETKLDYTVLRPGHLLNEPAGGCHLGKTRAASVSRETVANVLLASALDPQTIGLTFNVMDGTESVDKEIERIGKEKVDVWTG